jgi:hypothetical protein
MSENKDESGIVMGDYVEYRVPFFKSMPGIFFLAMQPLWLLLSIVAGVSKGGGIGEFFLSLILFELVFFLFSAKNLSYVKLSKNYFIVIRKFYCFTKEIIYENSNILEIQFEYVKRGRSGDDTIIILTKDADIESYKLDTFKRRTFFDLKNALIGYDINVTDKMNLAEKDFKTFMHK